MVYDLDGDGRAEIACKTADGTKDGTGKIIGDKDKDWWAGLAEVQVPVLAVTAAGDHQDPAWACRKLFEQIGSEHKQFVNLGREQGFSDNFGHVEMLVSKAAQTEVWPLVQRWLANPQAPLLANAADLAAAS